jgi:hypothetical protein
MHTVEPLVPESSSFEVQIVIKLKIYKSTGTDQILAELIQTGCNILCSEIQELVNSIWYKELPWQWKEYIIVP